MLGVSPDRISQLVSNKQLDAITVNGSVRISEKSVRRYAAESKRPGRPSRTSYATASRHTLMNADYEVATVVYDSALDEPLAIDQVLDPAHAPLGVLTSGGQAKKRELNEWWRRRAIPSSRAGLDAKLLSLGVDSPSNLAIRSMGLSLSDRYWLRPQSSPDLEWANINFFDNPFVESNAEGWDDWLSGVGLNSPDNTSEGELPKKWIADETGGRYLLKGCRTDDQRPVNEVVATALHRCLLTQGDYVSYDLVSTNDGLASRCANFLQSREEYVPASTLKDLGGRIRASNSYDRFCRTISALGADEAVTRSLLSKMIVCDVILANSDRHWRNFGFIRNIDTLELRPAPIFDSGNSLWYGKNGREVQASDWSFMPRPFAHDVAEALAYIDDVSWFDPSALDDFAEEACDLLAASKHATQPGRIDFIREGIQRNIDLVKSSTPLLSHRIERGL